MYPQITPWNIWDLPLNTWHAFAASADDYSERMKKESRG